MRVPAVNTVFKLFYLLFRANSSLWHWSRRRFTLAGFCVAGAFLVSGPMGLDVERTVTYQAFSLLLAFWFWPLAAAGFSGRVSP